jgi:hypothetical protein
MAEKRTPAAEATSGNRMPQTQLYEDLGPDVGCAATYTI